MSRFFAFLLIGLIGPVLNLPATDIIPRPQFEREGAGVVRFSPEVAPFQVYLGGGALADSPACRSGLRLLCKRLAALGADGASVTREHRNAQVIITRVPPAELRLLLTARGTGAALEGKRLEQAYRLVCRAAYRNREAVQITACSDLGIYYGIVTLCQLLENDPAGSIIAPEVRISDWPEVGLRLSKTSATSNPLAELQDQAALMPYYKLNVMGLQFHGKESNDAELFRTSVAAVCTQARQSGVLETIVYFCPFRGKGYDFNMTPDQQRYAHFLQWLLDRGASGIEVDYNDWPGRGSPIEDVINLACRAVAQKNPQAYVLYCPPNRGRSVYRGPPSQEMIRILSLVPTNVWPLWTGSATNNALIEKPLPAGDVEAWTKAAGRRPFLWVNRVGPRDRFNRPFMRPVPEVPGAYVFRGDFLPRNLNALFEGVHFNTIPMQRSDREMLAYLATAADYVWNPGAWDAVESCRRAKRFVEVMTPLMD